MPNRQSDPASGLDDPQHLADRTNRGLEKHDAEAAHHCVKVVGWKGQKVSECHGKSGVMKLTA